jgi:hypothetical protein
MIIEGVCLKTRRTPASSGLPAQLRRDQAEALEEAGFIPDFFSIRQGETSDKQ